MLNEKKTNRKKKFILTLVVVIIPIIFFSYYRNAPHKTHNSKSAGEIGDSANLASELSLDLSVSKNTDSPSSNNYSFFYNIFSPVERSMNWVSEKWTYFSNYVTDNVSLNRKNKKLEREVKKLNAQLIHLKALAKRSEQIASLENFLTEFSDYKLLIAKIYAFNSNSIYHTAKINLGKKHEVSPGDYLFNQDGLIGSIVKADRSSALVQLVSDINFSADVLVERNHIRSVIEGMGGQLNLVKLPRNTAINIDDIIVTSGLLGKFEKGIPIGKVVKIVNKNDLNLVFAYVKPFNHPSRSIDMGAVMKFDSPFSNDEPADAAKLNMSSKEKSSAVDKEKL